MAYAGVLVGSLLVAAVVYLVSVHEPEDDGGSHGFLSGERSADSPEQAFAGRAETERITYVPLAVIGRIRLRTRLAGLFGIVGLVAFAATALALAIYQAGHILNQTIAKFLGK